MQNRLRDVRRQKNITQEQLAIAAGISRPYLSDIERGRKIPGGDVVLRLANACGVSVEDLFFIDLVNHN